MIVFDLVCREGHVFEAWFGSSADYEEQKRRGLVACPLCDSRALEKAVMAPAVPAKTNRREHRHALAALRHHLETSCDYVGDRFADEARMRHARSAEGADVRGVYGEASPEEVRSLVADGVPVAPLPVRPRRIADA
ncbi:MAG: DUF1178 family protein [Sphingomonadaceae bacterium]